MHANAALPELARPVSPACATLQLGAASMASALLNSLPLRGLTQRPLQSVVQHAAVMEQPLGMKMGSLEGAMPSVRTSYHEVNGPQWLGPHAVRAMYVRLTPAADAACHFNFVHRARPSPRPLPPAGRQGAACWRVGGAGGLPFLLPGQAGAQQGMCMRGHSPLWVAQQDWRLWGPCWQALRGITAGMSARCSATAWQLPTVGGSPCVA